MRQIGKYSVEDTPIGSGGMGQVLRGYGPDGIPVAIKEILPQFVSDIEYRSRINSEIDFLKKVSHRNVVKVYDYFQLDEKLYIVMEFAEGKNIEEFVRANGPIPLDEAVGYMVNILDTMNYVHSLNIVHRDIKPGNIMIKPDGNICILDFGVAKDLGGGVGGDGKPVTVFGSVIGTDGYMSPEQAEGFTIDQRTDIYALGCVFFFMLTGHHAFEQNGPDVQVAIDILHKPFPRLNTYVKKMPDWVQPVLDHAVDKNMLNRFQTCQQFRDALAPFVKGTVMDRQQQGNITITVGRENCDILIGINNFKVSRHHADINFKQFTGGRYYVYTDCSSNGTIIDGRQYTRGMSYNIPEGSRPEIYLAGDPSCRLDVADIEAEMLRNMVKEDTVRDKPEKSGGRKKNGKWSGSDAGIYGREFRSAKENEKLRNSGTFFGSAKYCFTHYADFKGRANRSQYWMFFLFNMIVMYMLGALSLSLSLIIPKPVTANPMVLYTVTAIPIILYYLAAIIPSLAASARRFHDCGKSFGLYVILALTSFLFVPAVFILIFLCRKGEPVPNRYGAPLS